MVSTKILMLTKMARLLGLRISSGGGGEAPAEPHAGNRIRLGGSLALLPVAFREAVDLMTPDSRPVSSVSCINEQDRDEQVWYPDDRVSERSFFR